MLCYVSNDVFHKMLTFGIKIDSPTVKTASEIHSRVVKYKGQGKSGAAKPPLIFPAP
jgi:hypothetical protein